jgi:hypothetical protein
MVIVSFAHGRRLREPRDCLRFLFSFAGQLDLNSAPVGFHSMSRCVFRRFACDFRSQDTLSEKKQLVLCLYAYSADKLRLWRRCLSRGLSTSVQYSSRNSCALVQGLAVPCWRAHLCHQQAPPLLSVAPSRRCTAPLVPEGFWASDLNSDLSGPGLAPDLESSLGLRCGVVPGCCQGLETEVSTSSSFEDAVGSFE